IIQIPQAQGLAYARLSLLSPVTGLYVTLIVPLLYMITGTSKLVSIGPFSVIALMVGDVLSSGKPESYIQNFSLNQTEKNGSITIDEANIIVATTLTFLVGVILSIFHVGFISNFVSSTVTSSFIFGSACLVFTSQFQYLIGVQYLTTSGRTFSRFLNTYIDVFSNIKNINFAEVSISAGSIALSIILKYVGGYIEARKSITLPAELIVIVIFGGVSYGAKLNEKFNIRVVGIVPSGLPSVTLPDPKIFSSLVFDSMVIALVAYACTISLVRGLAEKSSEKTSYNKATLSAIIIVALLNVFKRVFDLKIIYAISLFETILWIVTSLATIMFGITYGLLIGSSISLLKILFGTLKPKFEILDEIDQSTIRNNICSLQNLNEQTNIVVFKFKGSIIYLNKLFFAQKLTKIFSK
ncbi:hypothetical protein MXB_178, partial [Myxobolus squamalis]